MPPIDQSLNDNICPKHGRFIGNNCTYCDYPPLFPEREQSAEKEQKQPESSRAVTSDTLIALLEERKELFRKNADDFDRGVQSGILEAIALIRKHAPSEISDTVTITSKEYLILSSKAKSGNDC